MKQLSLLFTFLGSTFFSTYVVAQQTNVTPETVVQKQLEAYNARDIDAFLATYSDDIELFDFPDKLLGKGKESMRKQYGTMFQKTKALHCEIVKRMTFNDTVIDHEDVTISADKPHLQAVAIYKVENGLIRKVYFIH